MGPAEEEDKGLQPSEDLKAERDRVPARAPDDAIPSHDGASFMSDKVRIELSQPGLFEVYFKAPADLITFTLDHFDRNAVAYDSDKARLISGLPEAMHFHPVGSEIYVRNDFSPDASLVTVAIDPSVRQAIEAEIKGGRISIETTINIKTHQSTMLARCFRQFLEDGTPGGRVAVDAMATLAVSEALQAFSGSLTGGEMHPVLGEAALSRVLDYIEAHLGENIRLDDLAAIACSSPHHFSRAFKASTGRPPSVYLLERRVDRAKRMLVTGTAPVSTIAIDCGFSSQSHMTTAFNKLLGITPARFRKEARG